MSPAERQFSWNITESAELIPAEWQLLWQAKRSAAHPVSAWEAALMAIGAEAGPAVEAVHPLHRPGWKGSSVTVFWALDCCLGPWFLQKSSVA